MFTTHTKLALKKPKTNQHLHNTALPTTISVAKTLASPSVENSFTIAAVFVRELLHFLLDQK
jgi:hypothetical protein